MPRTKLSHREGSGLEISHHRAEGLFLKLALGGLFGFVLFVAAIWAGHGFYVKWQEKRLVAKAYAAMEQGDVAGASLAARAALQVNGDSISAGRLAAEIAERSGDEAALVWRRKLAQTKGHTVEDLLALARCALQFNDLAAAKLAVAKVPEQNRDTAGFHAVTALIADYEKQDQKAESEWRAAVQLAPEEKSYQLQLGATQIRSNDRDRRASGAAILNGLRSDTKYGTAAKRILVREWVKRHESPDKILDAARDLQTDPQSTFADRILVADLLRQAGDPQFASYLSELEHAAVDSPQELATLISWMSQTNLNLLANDFIKGLKPEVVHAWPVAMAVADVYVRLQEWSKLEGALTTSDWRSSDFMRHAYLARALRAQGKSAAAEHEWELAIKGAAAGSQQTMMLFNAAAGWGWKTEQSDLLWSLTKYPDKEKEATQTLYRYYMINHDTHGLYRVLERLAEEHPDDLDVQNNLAQVSLLLEAKTDDARRVAADVYQKNPGNAAYATTYAFALLTKGDTKGAAKVMGSLTAEQLKDPAVSTYYGICLAALKDPRAQQFLDAGDKATLLPEEKALIARARSSIAGTIR